MLCPGLSIRPYETDLDSKNVAGGDDEGNAAQLREFHALNTAATMIWKPDVQKCIRFLHAQVSIKLIAGYSGSVDE